MQLQPPRFRRQSDQELADSSWLTSPHLPRKTLRQRSSIRCAEHGLRCIYLHIGRPYVKVSAKSKDQIRRVSRLYAALHTLDEGRAFPSRYLHRAVLQFYRTLLSCSHVAFIQNMAGFLGTARSFGLPFSPQTDIVGGMCAQQSAKRPEILLVLPQYVALACRMIQGLTAPTCWPATIIRCRYYPI